MNVQIFPGHGPPRLSYSPELREALLKSGCDVVLSQGLWRYLSIAVLKWHRHTKKRYVVNPHGMLDLWSLRHSGWKKKIAAHLFENQHLRHSACIRALCSAEADAVRAYGLRSPICVIPNGIDIPSPDLIPSIFPLAKKPELEGKNILLSLGRIHPKKNLGALLQAWKECGFAAADWMLVIAGWDELGTEDNLRQMVGALDLVDSVSFVGPMHGEAKDALYRAAAAFAIPSLGEGLPMAVLEAWAYGLPVLMTPQCNLPEGFKAGAAIQMSSDHADIARALRQLHALTAEERNAMGARGKALVQQHFDWKSVARKTHDVLMWLETGGPPPDCVSVY